MSGLYPDVPDARIPYDLNGTLIYRINGHVPVLVTGTNPTKLNSEFGDNLGGPNNGPSGNLEDSAGDTTNGLMFIFPVPINLNSMWVAQSWGVATYDVYTSVDTTNGIDGTWVQQINDRVPDGITVSPNYRNNIFACAATGIIAVKITDVQGGSTGRFLCNVHLFGHPTASSDRLEFWHPTLDQPLYTTPAFLDWSEVARGTVSPPTKDVRLKNLAGSLTANTITVDYLTLTDGGNNFKNAHTLSTDAGATYAASASIASIAPGAISGLIRIKYAPLITDELSLHAGRLVTTTGSWT